MKTTIVILSIFMVTACSIPPSQKTDPQVVVLEHYLGQIAARRTHDIKECYFIDGSAVMAETVMAKLKLDWLKLRHDFELTQDGYFLLKMDREIRGTSLKISLLESSPTYLEFMVLEYSGPLGAVQTFYKVFWNGKEWAVVSVALGAIS